jgi:hypothetical protein
MQPKMIERKHPTGQITASIEPLGNDADPCKWKVTLFFQERQITIDFFHSEGKPTARQIIERLSFETYSVIQGEKNMREKNENPVRQEIMAKLKGDEKKLRYLLGDRYFEMFVNDDKFPKVMVKSSPPSLV